MKYDSDVVCKHCGQTVMVIYGYIISHPDKQVKGYRCQGSATKVWGGNSGEHRA